MAKKRKKTKKTKNKTLQGIIGVLILVIGLVLGWDVAWDKVSVFLDEHTEQTSGNSALSSELASLEYDGENQTINVNEGVAEFTGEELSLENGAWQKFSDLDRYNRVGVANAMLHKSLMPTEERESLYVNPTGWKNKQFTNSSGSKQWLYNRCHLIGFQLTGENNNLKNLMTGTRSLNTPHMLYFENMVAAYLKDTGNHVRYRVEPIFRGDELVARGVHMQAQSVEDDEINFNVYIFNIEEGIEINYSDGSSKLAS